MLVLPVSWTLVLPAVSLPHLLSLLLHLFFTRRFYACSAAYYPACSSTRYPNTYSSASLLNACSFRCLVTTRSFASTPPVLPPIAFTTCSACSNARRLNACSAAHYSTFSTSHLNTCTTYYLTFYSTYRLFNNCVPDYYSTFSSTRRLFILLVGYRVDASLYFSPAKCGGLTKAKAMCSSLGRETPAQKTWSCSVS